MYWFFISLIINLALLFLPLHSKEIKDIAIQSKKSISIDVAQIKKDKSSNLPKQSFAQEPKLVESKPVKQKPIKEPKKAKKIIKKEFKKQNQKKVVDQNQTITKQNRTDNQTLPINTEIFNSQNNGDEGEKNKASNNENGYCEIGKGFLVLRDKKDYEFPKLALMAGLKGEYKVDVRFRILKNGNIDILDAVSKPNNKIFIGYAKKLAKRLEIKVLDQRVTKCTIVKPFVFVYKQ